MGGIAINDPEFQAFVNAEVKQESGGNYGAVSPDGALGKYQIMPANVASWSQQILGYSVTPQQYLASPSLQDQIAQGMLLKYVNSYGYAGAASAWYSGSPGNVNNTNSVSGGPSVAQYVQSVMANMGSAGYTQSGSSSTNVTGPYNPTSNVSITLSPQELAQQYGYAYSMLTSIPELNTLFQSAVAGQWSSTQFTAAMMNTEWYRTHSAAQRTYIAEGYSDPSTQGAQLASQIATTQQAASALGANVPASVLQQLSQTYLQDGWNSDQLNQALSKYISYDQYGGLGGVSGDNEMTLRALANNNGVSISNDWILNTARAIGDNTSTVEDAQAYIRNQAELKYPQYSNQIKAGQNLSDLAAPYIQDYQSILEQTPDQATLFNPLIQKALTYAPNQGNSTMPLWQFDTMLKQSPTWVGTQNAQNSLMGTAHTVLQNFGFES